jgi:HEAT repeat protein
MKMHIAAVLTASLGLVLSGSRSGGEESEPAYLGKPMSHWLTLLREEAKDPKSPDTDWSRAPIALAHIGEPAARGVASALGDASPSTRRRAALSLLAMGPKASAAAADLVKALHDDTAPVRQMAAQALGLAGVASADVVAGLIAALKDPETAVREACATSLGRLGAHEAQPALTEATTDPNWAVKDAAAKALERIAKAK